MMRRMHCFTCSMWTGCTVWELSALQRGVYDRWQTLHRQVLDCMTADRHYMCKCYPVWQLTDILHVWVLACMTADRQTGCVSVRLCDSWQALTAYSNVRPMWPTGSLCSERDQSTVMKRIRPLWPLTPVHTGFEGIENAWRCTCSAGIRGWKNWSWHPWTTWRLSERDVSVPI